MTRLCGDRLRILKCSEEVKMTRVIHLPTTAIYIIHIDCKLDESVHKEKHIIYIVHKT